MKKYFIAFFLFCLCLIVIDNTYAANGTNWITQIKQPLVAYNFTCSSSSNCSTSKNVYPGEISQYISGDDLYTGGSIYTTDSYTMPANGMAWVINTGESFRQGYIYMMTVYVCLTNPNAYFEIDDYSVSTAGNSYQFNNVKQLYNSGNIISPDNFITSNPNNMRCQYYSTLFVPKIDAKTYNVKFHTNTTVTAYYSLLGFEQTIIGLDDAVTNESLTSAINGSGLATAQSVQDVLDAQQQIQSDIQDQTQQQHDDHEETMNTLTDDDSSGATSSAGGFFNNFSSDTHGLTGIITAPLSTIQGLINNTCSPLVLPLPFVNRNLTLPCLSTIYSNYFGNFFTMYQTITLGLVSYWVLVRIFALVKDFKNPEHDEIEVVDL